ncbi:MAG: bacteriocin-protection protein YdeI/OmpD-associated family [Candidatus Doudnabacteria bacterium]|nr:bacteriocin-protection protein YdeI/OmpD-associated family [Candidatus Doudnabacteria bacterium]
MDTEYTIKAFKDTETWRKWLIKNHSKTNGLWMQVYKKDSGIVSVSYQEALEQALCFGWIDGQKKTYDKLSYIQKFTPRRSKSLWSKRNIELISKLIKEGLMTPAGLEEVTRAKSDGRWDAAYDKPSQMVVPDYFLKELRKYPKALQFFNTLNKTNTYAIAWRLVTAKTEQTRKRRQDKLLAMLQAGKKIH